MWRNLPEYLISQLVLPFHFLITSQESCLLSIVFCHYHFGLVCLFDFFLNDWYQSVHVFIFPDLLEYNKLWWSWLSSFCILCSSNDFKLNLYILTRDFFPSLLPFYSCKKFHMDLISLFPFVMYCRTYNINH